MLLKFIKKILNKLLNIIFDENYSTFYWKLSKLLELSKFLKKIVEIIGIFRIIEVFNENYCNFL